MDKDNIKVFIGSDTQDPCIIENEGDLAKYPPDRVIVCPKSTLINNYKELMRYNFKEESKIILNKTGLIK